MHDAPLFCSSLMILESRRIYGKSLILDSGVIVRVALSTEAVRTAFGQRIPKNLFARKKNYISITNHI